ncbi:hypothetical protein [Gimesia sp.]|uniref:hypothetical protein n=1 Tax=Gimesia sp. TaxID=2024833 RepID=UPI003A8F6671
MGRKKKPDGLKEYIGFNVKPGHKARFELAAKKAGAEDLSDWIRKILHAEADQILGPEDHNTTPPTAPA